MAFYGLKNYLAFTFISFKTLFVMNCYLAITFKVHNSVNERYKIVKRLPSDDVLFYLRGDFALVCLYILPKSFESYCIERS
jgi:hypothetical protein